MEVFYCKNCEEWFDIGEAHTIKLAHATMVDLAEYSEELYCDACGELIDNNIYDQSELLELLNKQGVKG